MTNCDRFRKHINAFADGELDVRQNAEALEHVNTCTTCAGRVAQIASMKAALKRTCSDVHAPPALQDKIRSLSDAGTELSRVARPSHQPVLLAGLRLRTAVPLAMAASLVLAALLWQNWPQVGPTSADIAAIAGGIAEDVRQQHRLCASDGGLSHHDESLTRDPRKIAELLTRDLGLAILVPDLSTRGFELVGADRCGIMGRRGSHVLYRAAGGGAMLSAFTVGRLAALDPGIGDATPDDRCYVSFDDSVGVVAWHDGPQTHVLCAELPAAILQELVVVARTARAGPTVGPNPVLALAN